MAQIAVRLSQMINRKVSTAPDCIGPDVEKAANSLNNGDVLLLENVRFHSEEEQNDREFSRALSRLADLYVDDAFGTAHRKHASTVGITSYLPAVAGFLLEKEIVELSRLFTNPGKPFAGLLGGAKVSDKIGLIENIKEKVDMIMIGGGMASTFLKAIGAPVGRSKVEQEHIDTARSLMDSAKKNHVVFILPVDVMIAPSVTPEANAQPVLISQVPDESYIVDIGPRSIELFSQKLRTCLTVMWNGPMGVYEIPQFSNGTRAIARVLADLNATTVVGGGSTAEAVEEMGLVSHMTHVSTGGGASLEFLEGKVLPGIAVLQEKR
jgi:phosphoglycerate kinase